VILNRKEFKLILIRKNLTQREAAERIGISEEQLSRLLNALNTPSERTRKQITRAFRGVSWERLFKFIENSISTGYLQ